MSKLSRRRRIRRNLIGKCSKAFPLPFVASTASGTAKYGGLALSEARQLKVLTDVYAKLKKYLAEAMPDTAMLKESASKMCGPLRGCNGS
jgi:hypothetical protein